MKTPLLEGLLKYKEENIIRFHMPGHYGKFEFGKILQENLFDIDVTEVDGTDNLSNPTGIIKNSLDEISKIYKAKRSFYLVNGSTSGIYVAIDSLTKEGDEVIIARNSHKSVYNICRKKRLKMTFLYPKMDYEFGVDNDVDFAELKKIIENSRAKVVVLTYPNYYGRAFDLKEIYEYIKTKDKFLIVDSAHGSNFAFSEDFPDVASQYSDICIYSLHKTLPAFTQISILTINDRVDENKIEENVRFYTTTSPSYILMASGELAIKTMYDKREELKRIKEQYEKAILRLSQNKNIKVYYDRKNQDFCKLLINTTMSGEELSFVLRKKYKIQSEMSIGDNILFMLGITHSDKEIEYLVDSILDIFDKNYKNCFVKNKYENENSEEDVDCKSNIINFLPKTTMSYNKNKSEKKNLTKIIEAEGKICAKDIIPYPPGIPLIIENEIVNKDIIKTCLNMNINEIEVYE